MVGRFVVGFGVSLSAIAECIYISEIAPAVSISSQNGFLIPFHIDLEIFILIL